MMMYHRSVVIGKFAPPHRGHELLINKAISQSDHVTVLVCDTKVPGFDVPVGQRVEWLSRMYATQQRVEFRVVADLEIDEAKPYSHQLWADYTRALMGDGQFTVFSSEEYGIPWAKAMGAGHTLVDLDREIVPVSATMVRSNPARHLDMLSNPVRAHFVPRVVIVGAESTGTTTLTKALAAHYWEPCTYEYGRVLGERYVAQGQKDADWSEDVFRTIVHTQNMLEDEKAAQADKVLICDTDIMATMIWWDRYNQGENAWVRRQGIERMTRQLGSRLYIITDIDGVKFEDDGTRDDGPHRRWMQEEFIATLMRYEIPHILVKGSHQQRMKQATQTIDALLEKGRLEFSDLLATPNMIKESNHGARSHPLHSLQGRQSTEQRNLHAV